MSGLLQSGKIKGQEGDDDVYGDIPNPRAEDDESDDNIGATFGDDDQDGGNLRRSVRHTPKQIQELENFYKVRPHPSEELKSELGRRLNLETTQIRCWFQNKRNQERVTSIEETECESHIPQLATLRRHCKNLSTLSTIDMVEVYQGLSSKVATEVVKLAQRMTTNYYSGITGSQAGKWEKTYVENERQNMRLMTRKNVNVRGEQTGIVLSAATSVWFPVSKNEMFDFLSNQKFRDQWDILTSDATSIEEKIKIQKSRIHGNYVSFLQIDDGISVLQETWNDASSALLVYAPLETDSMEEIMRGQNSDSVQILPSGFSILPDKNGGGCLLALGYQFLVSAKPTADVDEGFVKHVEGLMDHTIENIKSALSI